MAHGNIYDVVTAINLTAIIISAVSMVISLAALSMVIGQKLSSHKIEWKPIKMDVHDPFLDSDKEIEDLEDADSKTLEEALLLQRKKKKQKPEEDPLDEILQSHNF